MQKTMDKQRLTLWIVLGLLAVLVIYSVFFKGSVDSEGVAAAQAAGQAAKSYGGMVGGC